MTMHFYFALGLGSYFSFSFSIGPPDARPTDTESIKSNNDSPKQSGRATTNLVDKQGCSSGPLTSIDPLHSPSDKDHAQESNLPTPVDPENSTWKAIHLLQKQFKSLCAVMGVKPRKSLSSAIEVRVPLIGFLKGFAPMLYSQDGES